MKRGKDYIKGTPLTTFCCVCCITQPLLLRVLHGSAHRLTCITRDWPLVMQAASVSHEYDTCSSKEKGKKNKGKRNERQIYRIDLGLGYLQFFTKFHRKLPFSHCYCVKNFDPASCNSMDRNTPSSLTIRQSFTFPRAKHRAVLLQLSGVSRSLNKRGETTDRGSER